MTGPDGSACGHTDRPDAARQLFSGSTPRRELSAESHSRRTTARLVEPIGTGSQKPILTYARYIHELIYVSIGLSTKDSDDA